MSKFSLYVLGIYWLLQAGIAIASPFGKEYVGEFGGKAKKIEFRLEKGEKVLIIASQDFADVQLILTNQVNNSRVTAVDFPFEKRLPEVLLVSGDDCRNCQIVVTANSKADLFSSYLLKIERTEVFEEAYFLALRHAGELSFLQTSKMGRQRTTLNEDLLEVLENTVSLAQTNKMFDWKMHALTLHSEQLALRARYVAQKKKLNTVLIETEGLATIYRVQALYEIGSQEDDVLLEQQGYLEGMEISLKLGEQMLWAMGANYLGISLVNAGKFEKANDLLLRAYLIYVENEAWRALWEPLYNLSWASMRQGKFLKALKYATELKVLAQQFSDSENEAWAMYMMAISYGQHGLQAEAEHLFDRVQVMINQAFEPIPDSFRSLEAFLFKEKAEMLLKYGKVQEANDYANVMRKRESSLGFSKRATKIIYIDAKIAKAEGDIERAIQLAEQARSYDLKNGISRAYAAKGLFISNIFLEQESFIEASKFLIDSTKILKDTSDYKTVSEALNQAVETLNGLGSFLDAIQVADSAWPLVEKYANNLTRLKFSINRAKAHFYNNDFDRADDLLHSARLMARNNLKSIIRKDIRKEFLQINKELYEISIDVALQGQKDIHKSFQLAREYKAIMAADLITRIDKPIGQNSKTETELQQLLVRLNDNSTQWLLTGDSDLVQKARTISADLYKYEVGARKEREINFYKNLPGLIEHEFDEDKLILSYFLGVTKSWAWVLYEGSIEIYNLPNRRELEKSVNETADILGSPPQLRSQYSLWEVRNKVSQTANYLLAPIEKYLVNKELVPLEIIISPDGVLWDFPFSALVMPNQDRFLIEKHSIKVSPLIAIEKSDQAAIDLFDRPQILLVGNPNEFIGSDFTLPHLPNVNKELSSIKSLFDSSAAEISEFRKLSNPFSDKSDGVFSIVHFATHAVLNEFNPLMSGLILPMREKGNRFWIAPEIVSSQLKVEMVVLSGCNTSTETKGVAGGLNSLASAFLEAGTKNVVGSHWKIEDKATANLMTYFYKNITEKNMKIQNALAAAQIELKNNHLNWSDPYYWAGFQLISR